MKLTHLQQIQKIKKQELKEEKRYIFSINDIADPNLAFSKLFVHEKAHMNTYDEGLGLTTSGEIVTNQKINLQD